MMKIADDLKGEALLLWEASLVFELTPDELALRVSVPAERITEWFAGRIKPTDEERAKIREAVEKVKAELEPETEEIAPGLSTWKTARWGKPYEPTAEEQAMSDELKAKFFELWPVATDLERRVLMTAWPHFGEVVAAMRRHGIKFQV